MSVAQQDSLIAPLRGRRCWVVGCGFLGSTLLQSCRAVGMLALGVDCEWGVDIQGDARHPALLAAARAQLEPELIFCCAATHGGDEAAYRATYHDLPRALHAACPAAKLVFCSSSSVYAGQGGAIVTEESPCTAVSVRARLLLEAEAAVLGMWGCVARLVPLYGAGRCELLRRFVQREPELPGAEARVLNYVHRADAARALLLLARASEPGVFNVCADSFSKGAVYEALSQITGLPRATAVADRGRRGMSDQRVTAARLRALGWQPEVDFLRWSAEHWRNWS